MAVIPCDFGCLGTHLSPQAVWWHLRTPSLTCSLEYTGTMSQSDLEAHGRQAWLKSFWARHSLMKQHLLTAHFKAGRRSARCGGWRR